MIRRVAPLFFILLIGFDLAACSRPPGEAPNLGSDLSRAAFATRDGDQLDLRSIAGTGWDTLVVFDTCEDQSLIERTLGKPFDTASLRNGEFCYDIETGRQLLILTSGSTPTQWVVLNADRKHAVFFVDATLGSPLVLSKDHALFTVSEVAGERDLTHIP